MHDRKLIGPLVTAVMVSLFLHSVAGDGEPTVPSLDLKWTINTSAIFSDMTFGAGHQGCQTVWDVDGDGVKEILFGTRRGHSKRLWCFDANGYLEWIFPPMSQPGLPGDPTTKVSLVDVDNDGIYELCFAGRGGRLHVLNADGNLIWTWDEPNQQNMHGAPQAFDVNGDGHVEFFMNTNNGFIHRVSHDGQLVWTSFQARGNQGHPTICDLDQDGLYEVLWASQDYHVYCIDAMTGSEKWRFNMGANMETNQVIVADVNDDREYEVLAWSSVPTSAVICISQWGGELWRWTHPREVNIRLCQTIGDLDGDGSMDMVLMTGDAGFGIDIGGSEPRTKWEINFTDWSQRGILPEGATADHWSSYQLIADIDTDGDQEVLWLAPFPIVTDGATGEVEAYYLDGHIAVNRRQENGGWWGDVDDDGVSEWICELNGNSHAETQVYCLTDGGKFPAKSPWPEYYHCAYPAEYQLDQDWLILKGAYSNSLWFPLRQRLTIHLLAFALILIPGLRMRHWSLN